MSQFSTCNAISHEALSVLCTTCTCTSYLTTKNFAPTKACSFCKMHSVKLFGTGSVPESVCCRNWAGIAGGRLHIIRYSLYSPPAGLCRHSAQIYLNFYYGRKLSNTSYTVLYTSIVQLLADVLEKLGQKYKFVKFYQNYGKMTVQL